MNNARRIKEWSTFRATHLHSSPVTGYTKYITDYYIWINGKSLRAIKNPQFVESREFYKGHLGAVFT